MAQVRTSGKQAAARKVARERAVERAAEFRRRQEQLEELAVEYFVAADAVDVIEQDAEEQIAKIREAAAAAVAEARENADAIVQRMLDTKVTRDEVAERLGLPVREVKRTRAKTADTSPTDGSGAEHESGDDTETEDNAGAPSADENDAQASYAA